MQDNLHPPITVAVSVAHRDFVIRAHVADLRGVALLVLDGVVRAGDGHVLVGLVDGQGARGVLGGGRGSSRGGLGGGY